MPSLPNVSGREVVKAFANDGWEFARQKGSQ
jgi:predicted RNA binding protein YcfA (HicA-like mRNA interferase family)